MTVNESESDLYEPVAASHETSSPFAFSSPALDPLIQKGHNLSSTPSDVDWISPFTLPPLHTLRQPRGQSVQLNPPRSSRERAGSGAYYAAAWGSPYAASSPETQRFENNSLDSDLSSPYHTQSPRPVDPIPHESNRAAIRKRFRIAGSGVTKQETSERSNWLSDSDGSVAEESESEVYKTPTRKETVFDHIPGVIKSTNHLAFRKHKVNESTATITPEIFSAIDLVSSGKQGMSEKKILSPSRVIMADLAASQSPNSTAHIMSEKPLPTLPDWRKSHEQSSGSVSSPKRPRLQSISSSSARPKKKVAWKGKTCIIALPATTREAAGLPPVLSFAEVQQRMRRWSEAGYPINGFGLSDDAGASQSRPLYPEPTQEAINPNNRKAQVVFPDQKAWDAWVENLKEEKLRMLGVSLSSSDLPSSSSSVSAPLSRTSSKYPSLVASPPVLPVSVASNGSRAVSNPYFHMNSRAGSVVSPGYSPFAASLHGYKHSLAFPMQTGLTSPFEYPISQPSPFGFGVRSPLGGVMRSFSPLNPAVLANFTRASSMSPPVIPEQQRLVRPDSTTSQPKRVRQEPVPTQQSLPAREDTSTNVRTPPEPSQAPLLAHPTPRSHRQNLSVALQKGLDDAEAKVQIEPRPQESEAEVNGGDLKQMETNAIQDSLTDELPILKHPDIHTTEDGDRSDIETNPSIAASPLLVEDKNVPATWPNDQRTVQKDSKPIHKIQPSISKFNVKAKDFNPKEAFSSANFSFGNSDFSPASQKQINVLEPQTSSSKKGSLSRLNVEAPTFSPGDQRPETSSFSFSSAAFNVSAPEFNPSRSPSTNFKTSISLNPKKDDALKDSIFGKVSIALNSKASRRQSKAIPIIRPVSSHDPEVDEVFHEEDGRAAAPTDRQKRARRNQSRDHSPVYADNAPFSLTHQKSRGPDGLNKDSQVHDIANDNEGQIVISDGSTSIVQHLETESKMLSSENATNNRIRSEKISDAATNPQDLLQDNTVESRSRHLTRESSQALPTPDTISQSHRVEPSGHKPRFSLSALARPFEPPGWQHSQATPTSVKQSSGGSISPPSGLAQSIGSVQSLYEYIKAETSSPRSHDDDDEDDDNPLDATSTHKGNVRAPTPQKPRSHAIKVDSSDDEMEHVPSYEEIDAVMKQFENDPDLGIERNDTPLRSTPLIDMRMAASFRSDAPSPSPLRRSQIQQGISSDRAFESYHGLGLGVENMHHEHDSNDWDDALSPDQEVKLGQRAQFFDNHVNELIGGMLDARLDPLEKSLQTIENSLTKISSRSSDRRYREASTDVRESDADDEEEQGAIGSISYSARSPVRRRDRKVDIIRSAIAEALATGNTGSTEQPAFDVLEFRNLLQDFKRSIAQPSHQRNTSDLRAMMEDVISQHSSLKGCRVESEHEIDAGKYKLQVAGLESMVKVANERANDEAISRREADLELASVKQQLGQALQELSQQREASEAAQQNLTAFVEEKRAYKSLERELEEMELKNAALETTLEEYRLSADHFREEIWEERTRSKGLVKTLHLVREQLEDKSQARQVLKTKVERLHEQIAQVVHDLTHEQTEWRRQEADLSNENEQLKSTITHELKLRERAELDLVDLEKQLNEHVRYKSAFENSQHEVSRLQSEVKSHRHEHKLLEDRVFNLDRELIHAKETKEAEMSAATIQVRSDLEITIHQLTNLRTDSEAQISRLQSRLDTAEIDIEDQKARHDAIMTETIDSHSQAIREANEKREVALEEQHSAHEKKLADLRDRHTRAIHNSADDRHRLEYHFNEKLNLNDDKIKHLEGKVLDLEDRLDITKSAARAAVEAAMAKGIDLPTPAPSVVASPPHRSQSASLTYLKGSDLPEKISSQALRESIMVLQDQLLNREQTVEQLEADIATIDREAPNKIKEKDAEIAWLRELLAVKTDDLEEIIKALSEPKLDRDAIKDATIRLKANLQMEQQIRERSADAGYVGSLPSISSLSSYAASPRALPMAAAAAWGNWRKARDSGMNALSDLAINIGNQTPSKSTIGSSVTYLSGFVTPQQGLKEPVLPDANGPLPTVRPLALAAAAARKGSSEARPLRAFSTQPRTLSSRQQDKRPENINASGERTSPQLRSDVDSPHTPLSSRIAADIDLGDDVDEDASPLGGKDNRHLEDMVTE